jgi:hypothetical protein
MEFFNSLGRLSVLLVGFAIPTTAKNKNSGLKKIDKIINN